MRSCTVCCEGSGKELVWNGKAYRKCRSCYTVPQPTQGDLLLRKRMADRENQT